ncbi:MAG TPA: molybdate ABC transporter substrate-binding protein [Cyanobacteria bacterium UBA12227]|nr:molybdate ABC transporter substrate-binding protein [Cyanobacteria bacterium UBA12227]HAX89143.1 molybdate ABC transporter substrate-binding protein [Cyanobacteria bacterium UBA11370]HBY77260.1 molybdate ABC transporter substrate-binding protein [Cyanobacteria bacterium UBA11148]
MNKRRLFTWIVWMVAAFLVVVGCSQITTQNSSNTSTPEAETVTLTVSAAASLQDAMEAIAPFFTQQKPNITISYNFGSSGALQQQIEQGAPVDVFISAAPKQMNALQDKELLLADTRKDLLTNQVVLIIPKDRTDISNFKDLTGNKVSKIALGNPDSVPAGQYGKEVLTSLKLLKSLESKFIFAKDVRQVLSYVETGNVEAGIVYATDAKASDKVKVVATAPTDSHSPIMYPVAILKDSKNPDAAKEFIEFLSSQSAKGVFEKYGFRMTQN